MFRREVSPRGALGGGGGGIGGISAAQLKELVGRTMDTVISGRV